MAGFGVYAHIPFCSKRCDYCAFVTWTDRSHLAVEYVDACIADYARGSYRRATSVFFGGGTPSLIDASLLMKLLATIDIEDDAEITIECNPETLSEEKIRAYAESGVNRLSFGVQSFMPHVLESLGREHNPSHVLDAIEWARSAGIDSLNADIIYGAAGESIDDWRKTVEQTIALEIPHISAYALTVEQGTPLALDKKRHPNDDDQATKYEIVSDLLEEAGYVNYEISNWAKPGHACEHNLLYWAQGDYAALGCAAHGHEKGRRYWNVGSPEPYIERVNSDESSIGGEEVLTSEQRRFEANELSLRTRWGVSKDAFPNEEDLSEFFEAAGENLRLNNRGKFLAGEIATRLIR
jgi:putative oxygen-independent coproporphyrinogen III oxidase